MSIALIAPGARQRRGMRDLPGSSRRWLLAGLLLFAVFAAGCGLKYINPKVAEDSQWRRFAAMKTARQTPQVAPAAAPKPAPAPAPAAAPKPRLGVAPIVAVFDIENKGAGLPAAQLQTLTEYLSSSLAATGVFRVVPRSELKRRLRAEKKVSYKSCHEQSCQIEVGRELAAQKSLSTQVLRLDKLCVVTSVLYDLRRAASEGGARAEGPCSGGGIVKSIRQVIEKLSRR